MSSERIKLSGRRTELKQELEELEVRADNHIITIRDVVDPYETFTQIEIERAEQAMISLKSIITRAREIQKTIDRIDKDMGGS